MVGVAIPARDERDDIGPALQAVLRALEHPVLAGARRVVVVADDGSSDGTGRLARDLLGARGEMLPGAFGSAGAARRAAVERLVTLAGDLPPQRVWLATTDADSRVPPSWLAGHVRQWSRGADAVAGMVAPMWDGARHGRLRRRFELLMSALGSGAGHPHVFGANLGFTAEVYRASGGFAPLASGEDHALWAALRATGARVVAVADDPVATSDRLVGRAPDGVAALLARLAAELPAGAAT